MGVTEREQEIIDLLRREPLITPAELAERLGSTRAAVTVHLSNLGRKGVILGRGYILSERPPVVVVGGANLDIKARSAATAIPRTSNPGTPPRRRAVWRATSRRTWPGWARRRS